MDTPPNNIGLMFKQIMYYLD